MKTENIVVKVSPELEKEIAAKVAQAVKDSYYGNVGQAISNKITEKLSADGSIDRMVAAVLKKIQLTEDEYVEKISADIKTALLSVSSTLTAATLKAVEEKIKSYGFIQIGR